ncbi:MAG: fibrillarin-like rRNA/tRNA 2'-O-methyltransferase [Methanobacteriota archaeon]
MRFKRIFPGVYEINGRLATKNSTKGFRVYDEKLIKFRKDEYREWEPTRSKLAAAILKDLRKLPIKEHSPILYLGASSGTTASHIADVTDGLVFCVEYSKRMMRELLFVCEVKKNMIPILGDANLPQSFAHMTSRVDVVYQDVAQKNQTEIFIKNMDYFKARNGLLAIKARSIDCVEKPKNIFKREVSKLEGKFDVLDVIELSPFEKDHVLVSVQVA